MFISLSQIEKSGAFRLITFAEFKQRMDYSQVLPLPSVAEPREARTKFDMKIQLSNMGFIIITAYVRAEPEYLSAFPGCLLTDTLRLLGLVPVFAF